MDIVCAIGTAILAYLVGSIPTGYLVARSRGIDIRSVGSGNIGATNVLRILGKPAGIFVLVMDGLKGFVAATYLVDLSLAVLGTTGGRESVTHEHLSIVAGLCAMLGHVYTCWLRFKGGKGIATAAGILAAWVPWTLVIGLSAWGLTVLLTRFVSLASIAAAVSLPIGTYFVGYSNRFITITALMSALAIYKHKGNIERLIAGTERRFQWHRRPSSEQDNA